MTREEKAIMYFEDMRKKLCEDYLLGIPQNTVAYKATMAEKEFYDTAIEALEKEPCEDAVSRQALINKAISWDKHFTDSERYVSLTDIQNAPSVNPQEPKTGYWIDTGSGQKCSNCHEIQYGYDNHRLYCANCGTRMVESQEESEKYEPLKEKASIPYLMHKEMNIPISECQKAYDVAIDYLRNQAKIKG